MIMLREAKKNQITDFMGRKNISHNLGKIPGFVFVTAKSNSTFYILDKTSKNASVRSGEPSSSFDVFMLIDHSIIK